MLTFLGKRQSFCDGIHRRNFLKIGAFGAGLFLVAIGLGLGGGSIATALLAIAAGAAGVGVGLLWRSRRQEPHPWRVGDTSHYERRGAHRQKG